MQLGRHYVSIFLKIKFPYLFGIYLYILERRVCVCVLVGEIHESQSHLSATQLTVADFLASRKPPHSTPQYSPHGFVTAL